MSAEIVNLRRMRKRRQRETDAKQAEANRIFHGRSKSERQLNAAENTRLDRQHDAGRLEKSDKSSGTSET